MYNKISILNLRCFQAKIENWSTSFRLISLLFKNYSGISSGSEGVSKLSYSSIPTMVKDIAQSSPYVKFSYSLRIWRRSNVINAIEVGVNSKMAFGLSVHRSIMFCWSIIYTSNGSSMRLILRGLHLAKYIRSVLIRLDKVDTYPPFLYLSIAFSISVKSLN